MKKPWKQMWKDHLARCYGEAAERWENETHDDRLVFVNCYRKMQEALDSLDDEPNNYIALAVTARMQVTMKAMDEIAEVFKGR